MKSSHEILIGSQPNQTKGYILLDLQNKICFFVSRDVIFHETLSRLRVFQLLPNSTLFQPKIIRETLPLCHPKPRESFPPHYHPKRRKSIGGLDVMEYLKSNSGGIRCGDLFDWLITFESVDAEEMEPYWEEITRAFLLWLIGQVFLPNSVSTTKVGWLVNFHDLENMNDDEQVRGTRSRRNGFDWGSPTLACIYSAFGMVSSGQMKSFNGMWMVLEYWLYYYFHTLAPQIVDNPPVWEDVWPKIKVFNKEKRSSLQRDMGRHSISNARRQMEIRSIESTIWQPWVGSEHTHNLLEYSLKLSKKRCVFLDIEDNLGYRYLGERCSRQVTGELVIPPHPPTQEFMVEINPERCESCKGLRSCRNPVTVVSVGDYATWWSQVSVGTYFAKEMPTLVRERNRDGLALSSQTQGSNQSQEQWNEYIRSRVAFLKKENECLIRNNMTLQREIATLQRENATLQGDFNSQQCYAPMEADTSSQVNEIVYETQHLSSYTNPWDCGFMDLLRNENNE